MIRCKSFLTVFVCFLCLIVPAGAQTNDGGTKLAVSEPEVPDGWSISESLAKALSKFRADQKFQNLRDERIQLLESIPETRALIQVQEAKMAGLDAEITDVKSQIKVAESSLESEALSKLRSELASLESRWEGETARAKALTERRKAIETKLAEQAGRIAELETEIRAIEDGLEKSRVAEVEAETSYRKTTAQIESRMDQISGLIKILEDEFQLTKDEIVFENIGVKRRELLAIEAEVFSDEVIDARAKIDAAEAITASLLVKEKRRTLDISQERERSIELSANLSDLIEREQRLTLDIFGLDAEVERLKTEIERQIALDGERADSPANLKAKLSALESSRATAGEEWKTSSEKLQNDILRQTTVENEINDLFIPRSAENSFKLVMSFAFAFLVGLVIWKFFGITREDPNVRRVVFSAEAGIQFVTLFSLVIAIILFGITGILEGKELSALLGGISGYILGRATPVINEGGQPPSGGPSQPVQPTQPQIPQS